MASDNALFKMAGRYTNDWDVAKGAVSFILLKLLSLDGGIRPTAETLNAM